MRRVRFDDYRTTGRKCRCRVAARHRISEGEIAGAKNHHRPDRPQHRTMIGLGQRLAVGQRRLDARIEPVAALRRLAIKSQLSGGAGDLALQPHLGQSRLEHRPRDQIRGLGLEVVRDEPEKLVPLRARTSFAQTGAAAAASWAARSTSSTVAEVNDGSKDTPRAGSNAWKAAPPRPLEPKPMREPPSGFMRWFICGAGLTAINRNPALSGNLRSTLPDENPIQKALFRHAERSGGPKGKDAHWRLFLRCAPPIYGVWLTPQGKRSALRPRLRQHRLRVRQIGAGGHQARRAHQRRAPADLGLHPFR